MSADRTFLSSTHIQELAACGRIELSQDEKNRLSPDYLYLLVITKNLALSQRDRDRLKPLHLAHLAVTERIALSQDDKTRLPMALLFTLFHQGVVELSECQMACYRAAELDNASELEIAYSEDSVPMQLVSEVSRSGCDDSPVAYGQNNTLFGRNAGRQVNYAR